jgi:asparagine synthase (glutamine-hydrolysing)
MCGIVAVLPYLSTLTGEELAHRAGCMADAIRHRGPDAGAVWADAAAGVALAHCRLSIVDLSPAGAQPMVGNSGRYTIVFNGEIYNFRDIRAELPARQWRGHSDTEVLLAAIEVWGVARALARCAGMFALALWDAVRRELTLARDRMGEKPLYYGLGDGALLVASELKAFAAWPGWAGDIDRVALEDFLHHSCVHAPRSIYRQVKKLPPGCLLRIPVTSAARALEHEVERYWSLERHVPAAGSVRPAAPPVDALEGLLSRVIGEQMVADVPVGGFLSGGVDSSAIVALMQRQSAMPVRTFSIGFHEAAYNEAHHAKAVAAHLGTDHTELYVTAEEARRVIPLLPSMYDEPFGDSSQIPTFLVARLARRNVKVSLSGDGGDELFGGYNRHIWAQRVWGRMGRIPAPLRRACSAAVQAISPAVWDQIWRFMPARLQVAHPGDKVHKLAGLSAVSDGRAAYAWLVALYRGEERLVEGVNEDVELPLHKSWNAPGRTLAEDMMLADALGYLPDDVLTKVDRATMAVSLESRAPFLDHRVVEFAFSLPLDLKLRGRESKWLLRQLLYRHVPKHLIDRPKMGFGVPIDAWLRGALKPWARALLDPDRLRKEGYIRPQPVAQAWQEHQSGRFNHQHFLWNVLMFQSWLEARR